jgi:hypothetical protein
MHISFHSGLLTSMARLIREDGVGELFFFCFSLTSCVLSMLLWLHSQLAKIAGLPDDGSTTQSEMRVHELFASHELPVCLSIAFFESVFPFSRSLACSLCLSCCGSELISR